MAKVKEGAGESRCMAYQTIADDPWSETSWVNPLTEICKDAKVSGVGAREPVTAHNTLKA